MKTTLSFAKRDNDRWNAGPYVICKYSDGYFAYRYFRYKDGKRDAKRLHADDAPLKTLAMAKKLCERMSCEPLPKDIRLIDAP